MAERFTSSRRTPRQAKPRRVQSDWVRVVKTEGDRTFPVSGAKPEDEARIQMRMLARRNPDSEFSLCPVVQEVLQ